MLWAQANAGIALGTLPSADFDSPSFLSLALICSRCFNTDCRILGHRFAGEHVGVATDGVFRKQSNNIFHGKASFFRGDLGVKDDFAGNTSPSSSLIFWIAVV